MKMSRLFFVNYFVIFVLLTSKINYEQTISFRFIHFRYAI